MAGPLVLNIQKYAIHDGAGDRQSVEQLSIYQNHFGQ